jgi:O-antigen/teichoic acid export membrane protein
MATSLPANHLGQRALQPIDAEDAKNHEKYPHTLGSGMKFVLGVSMIAFGLAGMVACCVASLFVPAAAVPLAVAFFALVMSGRSVLQTADRLRLANHGFVLHKPPKKPKCFK